MGVLTVGTVWTTGGTILVCVVGGLKSDTCVTCVWVYDRHYVLLHDEMLVSCTTTTGLP